MRHVPAMASIAAAPGSHARGDPSRPADKPAARTLSISICCWPMPSAVPRRPTRRSAAPCRPASTSSARNNIAAFSSTRNAGIWREESCRFGSSCCGRGFNLRTAGHGLHGRGRYGQGFGGHPGDVRDGTQPAAAPAEVSLPLSGFGSHATSTRKRSGTSFWCSRARATFARCQRSPVWSVGARPRHQYRRARRRGISRHSRISGSSGRRRAPNSIVIYALLESDSTTGAYRFTAPAGRGDRDGRGTHAVSARRRCASSASRRSPPCSCSTKPIADISTTIGRKFTIRTDCRSPPDRASTYSGSWRTRSSSRSRRFTTQPPQGFGLVQRSREQSDFEDFDNLYERRPSAWVEPKGDWGAGSRRTGRDPVGARKQ